MNVKYSPASKENDELNEIEMIKRSYKPHVW